MPESGRHSSRRRRRSRRSTWRRYRGPLLALLVLVGVVALYWILLVRPSAPPPQAWAQAPVVGVAPKERTLALAPVVFPQDDAPHSAATEWWYYNGHLAGPDGQHYSFHAVVFLRDGVVRHTVFHGSLNEYRRGTRFTRQLMTGGIPAPEGGKGFDFQYEGWRVAGSGGEHYLKMGSDEFALKLTLTDLNPPVLHQAAGSATPGILDFGMAGVSYYYSRPRMKAHGQLSIAGAGSVAVDGEVWFDHQWGDFEASRLGWNWFALQMDDGANVMLYQLFDQKGAPLTVAGTYTGADGRSVALGPAEVVLTPMGVWKSGASGVSYPAGWAVQIPQGRFVLKPLRKESEFNGLETTYAHYWEGAVEVSGATGGKGFVEMSGYDHIPAIQAAE